MVDGTVGTFDFRLFCKMHLQTTEFSLVKFSMSIYYDLETRGISYLCPLNCFVNFSIIWFNMNCILQIVFSVLMTTINKLPKSQNTQVPLVVLLNVSLK